MKETVNEGTFANKGDNDHPQNHGRQAETDIDRPAGNVTGPKDGEQNLESEKPRILDERFEQVGSQQMTRSKLEFAPSWILDEAFTSKHDSNWSDAYVKVYESDVPKDANVVPSHVVYNVKTDEEGDRSLYARIVTHGIEENDKETVRKD